ncbi:MAG: protein-glutamate O-methyltransferase CheR [Rhodospirillales bacterium]|nr:protein-glutamate O-methyltransferase CheR [Rhodospirillales bacterium]MCB9973695.1 protein-glutamate O-methyltransferase CheR [Rhodospirillales bacterium]
MQIKDFDFYKDLLRKESGLVITADKSYLLDSRLTPVAKKWGHESIDKMTISLRALPDVKLIEDIVEAMTTNETSFFRDTHPFDTFKNIMMPDIIEKQQRMRQIRIWCAACSSGQEPYSLQMLMHEEPLASKLKGYRIDIDATDISKEILQQAQNGCYTQFEVQRGLPIQMLMKYFTQDGDKWKISDEMKRGIRYRYFNLLDSLTPLGKFDIIFCRNVLIYFDEATKADILNRMAKQLNPGGYLLLGGAETVLGITNQFKLKEGVRGLYVLNKEADAATPLNSLASRTVSP